MKQFILTLLLVLPLSLMAQERHVEPKERMTPEQQAILKAKEMRLKMDLTKAQEMNIKQLLENHLKTRPKSPKKPKQHSSEEQFQMRLAHLEHMELLQENMKNILTAEQFQDWKREHKKARFAQLKKRKKMGEERPFRYRDPRN